MSFGAFAGGLARGINDGLNQSSRIRALVKEGQLQKLRQEGLAEATQARNAATNELVKEVGMPDAAAEAPKAETSIASQPSTAQALPVADPAPIQTKADPNTSVSPSSNAPSTQSTSAEMPSAMPGIPPSGIAPTAEPAAATSESPKADAPKGLPGRFAVGDKRFETKEEALKYAGTQAPSLQDFQVKAMIPKMQEFYISQGDPRKAEEWMAFAEKRENRKNMDTWGKAYRAATTGNFEKAADHVFELYKSYNDGVTPISKSVVKDKNGNTTGFNVRLKNDKSGEEYEQFIDPKTLLRVGMTALSPQKMFDMYREEQAAADKQKREIAKEDRAFGRSVTLEGIRHNNALEKVTIQEKLKAAGGSSTAQQQINAKVSALKSAGYSDAFINEALPGIIGIGDYKKKTSPEEAKRLALSDRMKSDQTFARKTPAQQQAIIDQDMKLIYGGLTPTGASTPQTNGLPAPGGTPQGKKGVPVYDTKTKTMIYR